MSAGLEVGTVASPALLTAPQGERARLMARIDDARGIDAVARIRELLRSG